MTRINITFLENRVVQDQHAGTELETRYEAGQTYGFDDARSAARWVRRGAAEFGTKVDADLARAVVGDIVVERASDALAADAVDADEVALAARIGRKAVAAYLGLSDDAFAQMPEAERLDALEALAAEVDAHGAAQASVGAIGEAAGEGAPSPDYERLTDDELRALIADRDGRAPHHNTGRARLLDIAQTGPQSEA